MVTSSGQAERARGRGGEATKRRNDERAKWLLNRVSSVFHLWLTNAVVCGVKITDVGMNLLLVAKNGLEKCARPPGPLEKCVKVLSSPADRICLFLEDSLATFHFPPLSIFHMEKCRR